MITNAVLGGQGLWSRPGEAVVLPLVESTNDRYHIGVSQILERFGGEGATHSTGTVDR